MKKITGDISLNEKIKSLRDLEIKYQQVFEMLPNFQPYMIKDKLTKFYYECCIKQDADLDIFMKAFNINEEKQSFLARVQKTIEQCKKDYFKELETNLELSVYLGYDNYTPNTAKQIYSFISSLQQKSIKSLNIVLLARENGFRKSDLENLLNLSEILNQDLIVRSNQDGIYSNVSLSNFIEAYRKMDELVDKINSLNLSPFEKFLFVHDYAANRIYKKVDNGNLFYNIGKSRSFVDVMTSDAIVCAGYAQIVKTFCKRLGITCEYIDGRPPDYFDKEGLHIIPGHAANIVHIVDKKYNIDGWYFCDACCDSKKTTEQQYKQYFYAALPIQDMNNINSSEYFSDVISSLDVPKSSKPIPVDAFRKALNKIYSNPEQVEKNLHETIYSARRLCSRNSDNDFIQEYFRRKERVL